MKFMHNIHTLHFSYFPNQPSKARGNKLLSASKIPSKCVYMPICAYSVCVCVNIPEFRETHWIRERGQPKSQSLAGGKQFYYK